MILLLVLLSTFVEADTVSSAGVVLDSEFSATVVSIRSDIDQLVNFDGIKYGLPALSLDRDPLAVLPHDSGWGQAAKRIVMAGPKAIGLLMKALGDERETNYEEEVRVIEPVGDEIGTLDELFNYYHKSGTLRMFDENFWNRRKGQKYLVFGPKRGWDVLSINELGPGYSHIRLTVGDVCWWLIGAITNRMYSPLFTIDDVTLSESFYVSASDRAKMLERASKHYELTWRKDLLKSLMFDVRHPDHLYRAMGGFLKLYRYYPEEANTVLNEFLALEPAASIEGPLWREMYLGSYDDYDFPVTDDHVIDLLYGLPQIVTDRTNGILMEHAVKSLDAKYRNKRREKVLYEVCAVLMRQDKHAEKLSQLIDARSRSASVSEDLRKKYASLVDRN